MINILKPEKIFRQPTLTYKTTEILDILDTFKDSSPTKKIYAQVIQLLHAAELFREQTAQEELYVDLRKHKPDVEVQAIFNQMLNAMKRAERILTQLSPEDKNILMDTLHYCKMTIKDRMFFSRQDDHLQKIWKHSALKKHVD